ncbi:glycosyltransferase family 2 protein [Bacteroides sp.]|uniref:glycosyltransferase family 2 protein n=1 Tax=Bacteroides sp. TaxID=29523 RepID=UPI0025BAF8D6|nr:glycosyltransferase family 2 protein [Bacteroides sp.]
MKISIISPIYKAESIVEELVRQIIKNVEPLTHDFEIVLVNDASPDHSWMKIREICRKDSRVKGINLSRNFGQHYAITAGLTYASGEWIVVMDCDLQDRPDEIPNLYAKALEGWDIVYARRVERLDGFWKKMSSRAFHKAYSYLSGSKSDRTIANFGIYKRKVILEYNKMTEKARSFPSLIAYLGFKTTAIDVAHSERYEGSSSYTLSKLVRLTVDVLVSNSTKPLLLAVQFGFVISFISVLLALYNVIAYFTGINLVHGYTTTIFSIWFVGGMTIFVLGIVGLYIGKIFDEVKNRQLFIIDETINLEK